MQNGMPVKFAARLFGGRFIAIACVMVFSQFTASAQNTGRQFLKGHVPQVVERLHLQPVSRLSSEKRLNLAIGLPLHNQQTLDSLLQQIYDPASPNYRHYLTPERFTEQFGPTEQDYQKVIAFAKQNGLMVTGTSANRVLLDVSGSVADIEKAFQVTMRTYQHPTENRTFYAPDVEPSLDLAVPILDVSGLSDFSRPHPKVVISPLNGTTTGTPKSGAGSGPTGNYIGNDFRTAYVPGVSLTGAGQTVALVQFDGYYLSDITNYENFAGLPNVTLTNVLLDGFSGTPTGAGNGNLEVSLDIEMVISMAPGVSKIILYEGFIPNDVLNRIVTDNAASQISSSWGWSGGPDATTEQIFQQMIIQGRSYFNATGDGDAFLPGAVDNPAYTNYPSSSPNITQVGGTTLLATNPVSERVWNWDSGVGSSGGISTSNAIPYWQTNIDMTANHGSTTMRNIPDVALTADNVYVKYGNGLSETNVGGTSCAAPLWAGFTALVNQQALSKGQPPVGFINPAIYAIGKGPNYTADFHDVTTGNNTWSSSPANFYAVSGYDLCTGWGTPNGMNLITALATPDSLGILPGTGFTSSGPVGGPFNVTSQNFSLTNSGGTSFDWLLISMPSWLSATSLGGTLAAYGSTNVTVSLNSTASSLLAGIYATNLVFTNIASGIVQSRLFTLQVGQPLVQNGGFESGDFTGWTLNGDGTPYNFVTNTFTFENGAYRRETINRHSGTYFAALGEPSALAYLSQTVPTFSGQVYLLSLWMDSPDGETQNEFNVSWNGNTLTDLTNMPELGWTNLQFIVTATGPSTVLQFGARDDPSYLGLDDVNLWPIPNPSFRSVATVNNNAVSFSWNTFTNMAYQVQYSTDLTKTNWIILSTNTATGPILTLTNSYGTDPQRFYQIELLY
jgi:subtilase family serine protease